MPQQADCAACAEERVNSLSVWAPAEDFPQYGDRQAWRMVPHFPQESEMTMLPQRTDGTRNPERYLKSGPPGGAYGLERYQH